MGINVITLTGLSGSVRIIARRLNDTRAAVTVGISAFGRLTASMPAVLQSQTAAVADMATVVMLLPIATQMTAIGSLSVVIGSAILFVTDNGDVYADDNGDQYATIPG